MSDGSAIAVRRGRRPKTRVIKTGNYRARERARLAIRDAHRIDRCSSVGDKNKRITVKIIRLSALNFNGSLASHGKCIKNETLLRLLSGSLFRFFRYDRTCLRISVKYLRIFSRVMNLAAPGKAMRAVRS